MLFFLKELRMNLKEMKNKRLSLLWQLALVFSFIWLTGCGKPAVEPTPASPTINQYFSALHSGDESQLKQTYFEPLSWRKSGKLIKSFRQVHKDIEAGNLKLTVEQIKQNGRWALAVVNVQKPSEDSDTAFESQYEPYWFFYYDEHWQYISPSLAHTGPVRAMMDLYREQTKLELWFAQTYLNK